MTNVWRGNQNVFKCSKDTNSLRQPIDVKINKIISRGKRQKSEKYQ